MQIEPADTPRIDTSADCRQRTWHALQRSQLRPGLLACLVVVTAAVTAAVALGQQMVDTGWAVGKPSTLGPEVRRDAAISRPVVNPLSQTRGPVLQRGSNTKPQRQIPAPPSVGPLSDTPPHVATQFDWAASALSDFNLSPGRSTPSPTLPARDKVGGKSAAATPSDGDTEMPFRSPALLFPRRTGGDEPAASDESIGEPSDVESPWKEHSLAARPMRQPSSDIAAEAGRDAASVAESAPAAGPSAQVNVPEKESAAPDKRDGDRNLDTHDLDALLKSWKPIREPATSADAESKETGPRAGVETHEPRAIPVDEIHEAASPIELPEDRVKFKRKSAGASEPGDSRPQRGAASSQPPAVERREPVAESREPTAVSHRDIEQEVTPDPGPPVEALRPLTRNEIRLREKVRRVLKMYYRRPLNSRDHDPWEMMHGMLAYGVHSRLLQHGPQGKPITAVGWLCYNKACKGKTLLYTTPEGELRARWGVGVQGHYGQFLAMLAQCRVARNYPMRVDGREFTIDDLIEAEKVTCHEDDELTFKLIALMHYCPSDERWVNDQGATWDIRRLIREELRQPIRGAPCGGTHRLAGLSLAARTRVKRDEPLDGEFLQAKEFSDRYRRYAFQFQNSDGSLSTNWFRGRGDEEDINRRIKTSGHILEWLLYSSEDEELHDRRIFRAVNYLSNILYSNYNHDWEVGPLCHAVHALVVYDERLFQKYDGLEDADQSTAQQQSQRRSASRQRRVRSR